MTAITASIPVYRIQLERTGSVHVASLNCETLREAVDIIREHLGEPDREHFVALYLDVQYRVIAIHTVAIGDRTSIQITVAEVFKAGLLCNAAAVVLAHNHPSGEPTPSFADRLITAQLEVAGAMLGIPVLDHVVLGSPGALSMRELGQMKIPLHAPFDCGDYLRRKAEIKSKVPSTGKAKEEIRPEPSRAEWMAIPVDELREYALYQTELSSLRSVAIQIGIGRTTLCQFLLGRTKMPAISVRRRMALWYLRQREGISRHSQAIAVLLEGITDQPARVAAQEGLIRDLVNLHATAGADVPDWLRRLHE